MSVSGYGPSFGMLQSDFAQTFGENGDYLAPAGTDLKQGEVVDVNFATGEVARGATDLPLKAGARGIVVQEEAHIASIWDSEYPTVARYENIKGGQRVILRGGSGLRFWLKNRVASNPAGGAPVAARTIINLTGVTLGGSIGWDGTSWVNATGDVEPIATVNKLDAGAAYVEATLV